MKLSELRTLCIDKLTSNGIERPAYVTDLFISRQTGLSTAHIIANMDRAISQSDCDKIISKVEMRLERVPLSYILGEAEFYGHIFKVGEGCLIPRPETELLAEEMLKLTPGARTFADWCTGSGCIGITMILENDSLSGFGIDSSEIALKWARKNIAFYGIEKRFSLIKNSDASVCPIERNSLDFIVANPPYIPSEEIYTLMPDVAQYEPHTALDGGHDGMDIYRMLFKSLPQYIKDGGIMGFEVGGDEQAHAIMAMAPNDVTLIRKINDYSGSLRHIIWQKNVR